MTAEEQAWLDQVHEEALDPAQLICDPHHHLWDHPESPYLLDDLRADTGSGHNVTTTVFVDCLSWYRTEGPVELRPVGETERVAGIAEMSAATAGSEIVAIVSYVDLRLGADVEPVLAAHVKAGHGRFRGIRHATAIDEDPTIRANHVGSPPGLMRDRRFTEGLRVLASMGLSFDAWLYHPQLPELVDAARAVPDLTIVLDHLGGPVGIGRHEDRAAALVNWRASMAAVAQCPNVFLKVGGIGMPVFGIPWHRRATPPTSVELAEVWGADIDRVIDLFGSSRCMFESNFPVDKKGCSYAVLWNAFKRVAANRSAAERHWLFHDTAATAYRLDGAREPAR
jgi:predicted TIM-barrel fold metal-dependent hydrolase